MPLHLPPDKPHFTIQMVWEHPYGEKCVKGVITRDVLERGAAGGKDSLHEAVLSEFRSKYPGQLDHVIARGVRCKVYWKGVPSVTEDWYDLWIGD